MFSGYSLKFRKGRQCLRKLSCISSVDALPSRTSRATARNKHRTAHSIVHSSEGADGLEHQNNTLHCRGLLYRLRGLFRERGLSTNRRDSPSVSRQCSSSLRGRNWCLMRRTVSKSDDNITYINNALYPSRDEHSRVNHGTPRTSSASYEIISTVSLSNDEMSQSLARNGNIEFHGHESGSQRNTIDPQIDSAVSTNTPGALSHHHHHHHRPNLASSIYTASSSTSRARMPFLFGLSHRAQSLEIISSPVSYMSSPDLYLSNPDARRAYTSALQSPNLNRLASSPDYQESYRVPTTVENPVFRSFRQFPFESFQENQECPTFGLSQVGS